MWEIQKTTTNSLTIPIENSILLQVCHYNLLTNSSSSFFNLITNLSFRLSSIMLLSKFSQIKTLHILYTLKKNLILLNNQKIKGIQKN